MKNRRGFSLVGALIVVIIISTLTGLIWFMHKFDTEDKQRRTAVQALVTQRTHGKIIQMEGVMPAMMRMQSGLTFPGNDSLVLVVKAEGNDLPFTIDLHTNPAGPQTNNNLAVKLKIGDNVSFPIHRSIGGFGTQSEPIFSSNNVGVMLSTDISIDQGTKPEK